MDVIDLARIDRSMTGSVGAKAAGLGEMLAAGECVPPGFCLTTDAYRSGRVPEDEVVERCRALGDGPVAVRSSATAEDLPDASFAGQQDTYLPVRGTDAVLRAIRDCWRSLRTERAVAYRAVHRIPEDGLAMAVVVQRMVDAHVAGVLFTANPLTGCRTQSVLDAAPGLGTAVVDGTSVPDHYVLDATGSIAESVLAGDPARPNGCLHGDQLHRLWRTGQRMQRHFGAAQDIEWAFDADGRLWLLQSRPITTLFPLPDRLGDGGSGGEFGDRNGPEELRAYLEVGHLQGLRRPLTPMGAAVLERAMALWSEAYGIPSDRYQGLPFYRQIAGRMFVDLSAMLRNRWLRGRLPKALGTYGPRVRAVAERLTDDPRFAARPNSAVLAGVGLRILTRTALPGLLHLADTLARPVRARNRAFARADALVQQVALPPEDADAAERLRQIEQMQRPLMSRFMGGVLWPVLAGMLATRAPAVLLRGLGTHAELGRISGGLSYDVTTEMDRALWRIAVAAGEHGGLFRRTSPQELAVRYRAGELPDIGLDQFLARYGHRTAVEIDVGVPRWAEDPAPLFGTIANYLLITDPEQSPERRFERAADEAERTIAVLAHRARGRPFRGSLAVLLMRRARELGGLRELGKFTWVRVLREVRTQLMLVGDELVRRGRLRRPDDVMFLELREAWQALNGQDQQDLVRRRREIHERECGRPSVPIVLLSDGTDAETLTASAPNADADPDTLVGMAAASGQATGPARVVHDPRGARLEPGEILVAATTDPGWTPLFMSAGGLVTETGALVAHGPTVAREYGLPAVICVRDATTLIRTGQTITVDGNAGTVRLENDNRAEPRPRAEDRPRLGI